jgi:hypothetical protein
MAAIGQKKTLVKGMLGTEVAMHATNYPTKTKRFVPNPNWRFH